jgi:hypothetical protein
MQNIITLHCGIENCNTHYEYNHNAENIISISAKWRNEESKEGDWGGLLSEQPIIGRKYEILINFALRIDLTKGFWATYFEPYTEHEGIESELGINSMLFCLCKCEKVIDISRTSAKIEVEVIETKSITEDHNTNTDSNRKTILLDGEINSKYVSVVNFNNFSIISASYQSDFGWTYIIEKKNSRSRIVAENNWDFHTNVWKIINEELNEEQEKKYGIQH